jgi:endonuclease YncB( thermonuclease family)
MASRPFLDGVAVTGFAALLLIAAGRSDAAAVPDVCPSAGIQAVTMSRALNGSSFVTADGAEVTLAGILAPASGIAAEGARESLERKLLAGPVMLAFTGAERDRYGRRVAQVYASGGWVQGALLQEGEVMAAPDALTAPCARNLLAAEAAGRQARAGLWRNDHFKVLSVEELMRETRQRAGTYQIVEGRVLNAAVVRGRAYLNFGVDRATDFTATIAPADMARFRRAGFDPRTLAGKIIRLRGWLEIFNGPNMQIAVPGAIDIVGE